MITNSCTDIKSIIAWLSLWLNIMLTYLFIYIFVVIIINFIYIIYIYMYVYLYAGIFLSIFLQPVNGSKNLILNWVMKLIFFQLDSTTVVNFSSNFPMKLYTTVTPKLYTAVSQDKKSEKVLQMHFLVNCRPKFRDSKFSKQQRNWL